VSGYLIESITIGASGVTFITIGTMVETHNFRSRLLLNIVPMLLGPMLCALTFGRIMGWPI
jgi:hypothetical protein